MSAAANKSPSELIEEAWKAAIEKRIAVLREDVDGSEHERSDGLANEWFGRLDEAEQWLLRHLEDLKEQGLCDVKQYKAQRETALKVAAWYGKAVEEDIFQHWKADLEVRAPHIQVTRGDFRAGGSGGINIELLTQDVVDAVSKLFGCHGGAMIENDFALARSMAKYIGGSFTENNCKDVDNVQAAFIKALDEKKAAEGKEHKTPFFRALHKMVSMLVHPETPAGWQKSEAKRAENNAKGFNGTGIKGGMKAEAIKNTWSDKEKEKKRKDGEKKMGIRMVPPMKAMAKAKTKAKAMKKVPAMAKAKAQSMKKVMKKDSKKDGKKPPMKKK